MIDIPDIKEFVCEIETPQHKDGKVWFMLKQWGFFNTQTLRFKGDSHDVQFHKMTDFQKALIQIKL